MFMRSLVIGTRGSSLAMCQAQIVQTKLEEQTPARTIRLKAIKAYADRNPELSLVALQGEGVFVKELESAILNGEVDLAVHSMKDLPLDMPDGLRVAAVLEREEPRDVVVARDGHSLDRLPSGSRIGTSSARRRSQLLHQRGDLQMADIRGNLDTRLRKLDEGRYDAIVVAGCGLIRLGLEAKITEYLDFSRMLPEPGQGAIAVEARADDEETLGFLRTLDDATSRAAVESERAFLRALGGGCRVPIAAYASCEAETLHLEGAVIAADGGAQIRGRLEGPMADPLALGERLADQLRSQGAAELLNMKG